MYSIIFTMSPSSPPPKTPLVEEETLPPITFSLAAPKSPKSVTLPVEAIVTYSITLSLADPLFPPPITALVALDIAFA